MIAYTDAEISVTAKGIDLSTCSPMVTVKQFDGACVRAEMTDTMPTVAYSSGDSVLTASFTQSQTGKFLPGPAYIQVNYTVDGRRYATQEGVIRVERNLVRGIVLGVVETYSELPTSGMAIGDIYVVETADAEHGVSAGDYVVWDGNEWVPAGRSVETTDIPNAFTVLTTSQIDNMFLDGGGNE